jgi:hypothetical protein
LSCTYVSDSLETEEIYFAVRSYPFFSVIKKIGGKEGGSGENSGVDAKTANERINCRESGPN